MNVVWVIWHKNINERTSILFWEETITIAGSNFSVSSSHYEDIVPFMTSFIQKNLVNYWYNGSLIKTIIRCLFTLILCVSYSKWDMAPLTEVLIIWYSCWGKGLAIRWNQKHHSDTMIDIDPPSKLETKIFANSTMIKLYKMSEVRDNDKKSYNKIVSSTEGMRTYIWLVPCI